MRTTGGTTSRRPTKPNCAGHFPKSGAEWPELNPARRRAKTREITTKPTQLSPDSRASTRLQTADVAGTGMTSDRKGYPNTQNTDGSSYPWTIRGAESTLRRLIRRSNRPGVYKNDKEQVGSFKSYCANFPGIMAQPTGPVRSRSSFSARCEGHAGWQQHGVSPLYPEIACGSAPALTFQWKLRAKPHPMNA